MFPGRKNFLGNKEATPIPINLFQITSCIVTWSSLTHPAAKPGTNIYKIGGGWGWGGREHFYSYSLKVLHIRDENEFYISSWATANKNIFYVFPPLVHQNKVTSVLPSLKTHAIAHHLFVYSQKVANSCKLCYVVTWVTGFWHDFSIQEEGWIERPTSFKW